MRSNLIIAALVIAPTAAAAQSPGETPAIEQQAAPTKWTGIGLAVDLGWTTGIAAGVQAQKDRIGVRVTAGWNPIIFATDDKMTDDVDLHGFHTAQINADVFVQGFDISRTGRLALALGYRYNTLLGHGGAAGIDAQLHRSANFGWHVYGGVAVFPQGVDRIEREKGLANVPDATGVEAGLAFGVTFLP
ncbi:MAG: hypothetical protein ABI867_20255 [Kofleriaceae bacterium]